MVRQIYYELNKQKLHAAPPSRRLFMHCVRSSTVKRQILKAGYKSDNAIYLGRYEGCLSC